MIIEVDPIQDFLEPAPEVIKVPEPDLDPVVSFLSAFPTPNKNVDDEYTTQKIASIRGRVNIAHFVPE